MARGPEHYAAAVQLIAQSRTIGGDDLEPAQLLIATLLEAQVHAALAHAAATALSENGSMPGAGCDEWAKAAERVTAFLDAFEDPAHPYHGTISTLRSEGLRLTTTDLRALLADRALTVWWLDDGGESPEPDLYTTDTAAQTAAVDAWKAANPFTEITNLEWLYVDSSNGDPHVDTELNINHQYTGHVVRARQPKGSTSGCAEEG